MGAAVRGDEGGGADVLRVEGRKDCGAGATGCPQLSSSLSPSLIRASLCSLRQVSLLGAIIHDNSKYINALEVWSGKDKMLLQV